MNPYRIDFDALEWESPAPGVRHKVVLEGELKLRLVEYTRELAPHWCAAGHAGRILEGRLRVEFADGTRVFEAGDGVLIPSGDEHRHRATVLSGPVRAIFVEKA